MPNQKPMWTRCLGGFSVKWVTKLLIFPVEIRIFCPKTTKFGPKLAFLVNLGQAMQAYSVPCWWVGWWLWRAGCISQDTYLLYVWCTAKQCKNATSVLWQICLLAQWCRYWQSKDWLQSVAEAQVWSFFLAKTLRLLVEPCLPSSQSIFSVYFPSMARNQSETKTWNQFKKH